MNDEQAKLAFPILLEKGAEGKIPFGSIIGSVEIVDCVINHPSVWAEKTVRFENCVDILLADEKDIHPPIYNWVLANPVLFDEPIPNVKGKLSFWECELPAEFGHYEFLHPLNHG